MRLSDEAAPPAEAYCQARIPLNLKKSVKQQSFAEVQGAELDGREGSGRPEGDKLAKYVSALLSLLRKCRCTQKEIRIVAGGLVYFSMFRRALMQCLNYIWQFIQSFETQSSRVLPIPEALKSELLLFMSLIPLAQFRFPSSISGLATASDASMLGGDICASECVSSSGASVASLPFLGLSRADLPEKGVVCIGLFDGISGLCVALEAVRAHVCLHVSVESDVHAHRVVETSFQSVQFLERVEDVTPELCQTSAGMASNASIVVVGAGPPCQGVSCSPQRGTEGPTYVQPIVDTPPRQYWLDWGLTASESTRLYLPKDSHPCMQKFDSTFSWSLLVYLSRGGVFIRVPTKS